MYSFVNTNDIRELAIEYLKYGQYPYYDEYMDIYREFNEKRKPQDPEIWPTIEDMSYNAQEFALYWIDRFVNGVTNAGVYYTGEHLFYLNMAEIDRNFTIDKGIFKDKTKKARKVGSRGTGFPDFWDEDYRYFATCDIARYGTSVLRDKDGVALESHVEAYNRIYHKIDLGLIIEEDNLAGGLNHLWLKPRGVGFSWKLANWNVSNLYIKPKLNNFVVADSKGFLGNEDGIMAKINKLRSFVQSNAWFMRKNFYKSSMSDYSFATGHKVVVGGSQIIKGFQSSISGIIIDGDSDKARGKRGNISFEEFGSFPKVGEVWKKAMPSVNQYGTAFAQIRGGGTGGGTDEGYADLEAMFYDPKSYAIIRFKNDYDDDYRGNGCSMFTPAYVNTEHVDENGNTDIVSAKEELDAERAELKKSPDLKIFTDHCAEKPYKPREAFNASGNNILPIQLAKDQLAYLSQTDIDRRVCRYGDFERTFGGIKFVPKPDMRPYEEYPVKSGDKEGCIVILKEPFRMNGEIPDNLYIISVDPYSDEEAVDSPSIGSFLVEEGLNGLTQSKGDLEVCWYDGRPEGHDGQDRFCRRLFWAAEYYNAKIVIENNEKGNVVHYAETHVDSKGRPLTNYLEGQLGLSYDVKLATKKKMKREYGIHMNDVRKRQGIKDYQENLLRPRGKFPDGSGRDFLNINTVYNRGLLNEIIHWKGKNADRLSARIVRMFARKDFDERKKPIGGTKKKIDSFFQTELY
jgi:hypothetical protein